jgi:hypothetical protein
VSGTHLSEEEVVDAAEGRSSEQARAHAAACGDCRDQVRSFTELTEAAAAADVPEPSPQYWQAMRGSVRRRIDHERSVRRAFVWPALAAAAVVAFVLVRPAPVAHAPVPQPVLPSWSALPPMETDSATSAIEGLGAGGGDALAEIACRNWQECAAALDDDEASDFRTDLQAELGGSS